jgi:hypothetical protein
MSATDTSPSLSTPPTPDGPASAAAKAVELIAQQYRDAIAGLLEIMPLLKYDSRQTRPLSESATASYREQPLDAFCRRDSLSEDFVFPKTKDSPTHRLKFARPFDIPLPVRNAFGVPVGCVRGGCTTIAA